MEKVKLASLALEGGLYSPAWGSEAKASRGLKSALQNRL
jgi:hypothetical protein